MDKQSDTSDAFNTFELEILKKRLTNIEFLSLFQRVSNILHLSVAVHIWDIYIPQDTLVWSNGDFPLCSSVLSELVGNNKCFIDRYTYTKKVTRLNVPLFYKCHVGFSCGVVHLISENRYSVILTVGPFYIEETIDIFYSRVIENIEKLNLCVSKKEKEQIKSLPHISIGTVREILLWTKESFQLVWERLFEGEMELKSRFESERKEGRKEKKGYININQCFESFDRLRGQIFLIAMRMGNKKLMELVLKGKGEELYIQQKKLQEVKFSLYAWVMNILGTLLVSNIGVELISKERLLMFKDKFFLKDKSLKIFIRDMIKTVFLSKSKSFSVKENVSKRFNDFFSIVERELMVGSSLLTIAKYMQMTPSALSHWIKRNIGINYEELLDYVQVEKIAEFLRNTDKNLSEIGDCVGIRYSSLVSEKFKRITGVSPTEYKTYFQYRFKE